MWTYIKTYVKSSYNQAGGAFWCRHGWSGGNGGVPRIRKNPITSRWVLEQQVRVQVERGGRTHVTSLASARRHSYGLVGLGIAEEYSEIADEVGNLTVNDEMHEQLERRFDEIRYKISLCTEKSDCRGAETTRKNFNQVTWDNEVKASYMLRGWWVVSVDTVDEIPDIKIDRHEEHSIEDWPEG